MLDDVKKIGSRDKLWKSSGVIEFVVVSVGVPSGFFMIVWHICQY